MDLLAKGYVRDIYLFILLWTMVVYKVNLMPQGINYQCAFLGQKEQQKKNGNIHYIQS